MNRKTTIPLFLTVVWLFVVAWQGLDHFRFKDHARTALLNRARDITNSLAIVIRSQKRFGSVIPKDRLESALQDLTRDLGDEIRQDLLSLIDLNGGIEVLQEAQSRLPQYAEIKQALADLRKAATLLEDLSVQVLECILLR